jgi:hypothetical protein
MLPKNKITGVAFLISILFFNAVNSFGQMWVKSDGSNSFYLHNLFFHDLKAFSRGIDSNFYVLSSHKPDAYWEKKNENKSELLVSRIDSKGNITLLTKLKAYINNLVLKIFNNKYYLLDNEYKVSKKQYYYLCYVYNFNWELESQLKIPELPHQSGFSDFIADKEGNLFLLTKPYFIDHKQEDFKGSYFVKCSLNGELLKKVLFDKSYCSNLRISNDSILFQLYHQRLVYPFYQTDSIIKISSDNELNYRVTATSLFIPKDRKIDKEIFLTDGDRVIYMDSSYALSPNSWTSTFKIALFDKQNSRKWSIEPSNRWLFSTPKPLQNGTFITQIDKRWDSTCLVVFDKNGDQKSIRSFVMNADTRIDRYSFIDFFETGKNEIWIFYKKQSPTREEEIYFERLLL